MLHPKDLPNSKELLDPIKEYLIDSDFDAMKAWAKYKLGKNQCVNPDDLQAAMKAGVISNYTTSNSYDTEGNMEGDLLTVYWDVSDSLLAGKA